MKLYRLITKTVQCFGLISYCLPQSDRLTVHIRSGLHQKSLELGLTVQSVQCDLKFV